MEYEIKSGDTLSQIALKYGVSLATLMKYNNIANADKISVGLKIKIPDTSKKSARRVDFAAYMEDKVNGGNRNRPLNIADMEQIQDSLIARGYPEPQRLALLATAAQEMGRKGLKSPGVGGNGGWGLSEGRMPLYYLEDNGKQINYVLNDLETIHSNNWLNGGSGGPVIMSGKDGFELFWNATDPEVATVILNKSYIRPAGRIDSWNNRKNVAKGMSMYMHKDGGKIHIKKSHEGKFTDYCGGNVTSECIARGKASSDPAVRKRATFAANARKWKHENGGIINYLNLFK